MLNIVMPNMVMPNLTEIISSHEYMLYTQYSKVQIIMYVYNTCMLYTQYSKVQIKMYVYNTYMLYTQYSKVQIKMYVYNCTQNATLVVSSRYTIYS